MLGLLNIAASYTADYYLSVSTTFTGAGMVVGLVAPEHVASNAYWQKVKPIVDWQFMLVLGIPIGAYLAARLSQKAVAFSGALPDMWVSRFGTSNISVGSSGFSAAFSSVSARAWPMAEPAATPSVEGFKWREQLGFSHRNDDFRHHHGAADFSEGVVIGPLEIIGMARSKTTIESNCAFAIISVCSHG